MIVINDREVELSEAEAEAWARFGTELESGHDIADAADLTVIACPGLEPAFYDWLRR